MDNLGNLEDKVMLLVQTIRKHKDEEERLRTEIEGKDRELEAAGQEKESLQRKNLSPLVPALRAVAEEVLQPLLQLEAKTR